MIMNEEAVGEAESYGAVSEGEAVSEAVVPEAEAMRTAAVVSGEDVVEVACICVCWCRRDG